MPTPARRRTTLALASAALALSASCSSAPAPRLGTAPNEAEPPIEVLLVGTFHFSQTDTLQLDVLREPRASEVTRVVDALVAWKPDRVFVEWQPEFNQHLADSLMKDPAMLTSSRRRNEVVQLGMRTARALGQERVYAVDHPGRYGDLYAKMKTVADANGQQAILDGTAPYTRKAIYQTLNQDSLRSRHTIPEFMRILNGREWQALDMGVYAGRYPRIGDVRTNLVDTAGSPNAGAELVADWYRRNVMIYGKMLKSMDFKERRIVLIIGNGHISILRHLFESNGGFRVVDALTVLPEH